MMTENIYGEQRARFVKRRVAAAALLVCALAAAYVLYVVDPYKQALLPCLLYKFTGIFCPGCGNTRALHALLHGDLHAAFNMNAFTVLIMIPLCAALALSHVPPYLGFRPIIPRIKVNGPRALVFMGALILFGVLRNVPAFAFLAPG